jgi:hypothetical protein
MELDMGMETNDLLLSQQSQLNELLVKNKE